MTGTAFADDYKVEAALEAEGATVTSHYELIYEITVDGVSLGTDWTVFVDMEPGERRTEGVFNTINSVSSGTASCEVIVVRRKPA